MDAFLTTLALLLIWHAIADYPLQGDFLASAKNRFRPIPGVPWQWALGAHAAIHAGGVWLITDSAALGLLQFVAHAAIDDWKCRESDRIEGALLLRLAFHLDQFAHLAVMVVTAAIAAVLA